ncbi:MAG TPA: hypothetical protein VGN12_24925 [Pirellulales bacterium]
MARYGHAIIPTNVQITSPPPKWYDVTIFGNLDAVSFSGPINSHVQIQNNGAIYFFYVTYDFPNGSTVAWANVRYAPDASAILMGSGAFAGLA